jgi:hypothetical protein
MKARSPSVVALAGRVGLGFGSLNSPRLPKIHPGIQEQALRAANTRSRAAAASRWHKIRAIANGSFESYQAATRSPAIRHNQRKSVLQKSIRETMHEELGGLESLIVDAKGPSEFFCEESKYMRGWDLFMLSMIVFTSLFTVFEIAVSSCL